MAVSVNKNQIAYEVWLSKVNSVVEARLGLSLDELPDLTDLGGLHSSDVSVADAADEVISDQLGEGGF